jgi:CheY-like chemotaxis protein
MTGYGQNEDRLQSREAGFNAHMVKPVDLEQLQSFLARAPKQVGDA